MNLERIVLRVHCFQKIDLRSGERLPFPYVMRCRCLHVQCNQGFGHALNQHAGIPGLKPSSPCVRLLGLCRYPTDTILLYPTINRSPSRRIYIYIYLCLFFVRMSACLFVYIKQAWAAAGGIGCEIELRCKSCALWFTKKIAFAMMLEQLAGGENGVQLANI